MNKYNARQIKYNGIVFDSVAEANRYAELLMSVNAGAISDLSIHPHYLLLEGFQHNGEKIRPVYYEADFEYSENGQWVVEDVKGVETEVFKIKRKLFLTRYGGQYDFRVVKVRR